MARSEEIQFASQLRYTIARSARRLRQEGGTDLGPSQLAALGTVERFGPLTPSELAEREGLQRPTITRVCARLQQAGLVVRAPDPSDGRHALISVTAAGTELLADIRTRKDAFLSERLDALSPAELQTLRRATALLERVIA